MSPLLYAPPVLLLVADQTLISDALGNTLALFNVDGATFNNARIVNLTSTNIQAESIYDLEGLPVDMNRQPEGSPPPAVQLFIERGLAADPRLGFGAEELNIVQDVVRVMEGLPLGVEIAAAGLRSLTLAQLRDRLLEAP